MNKQIDIVVEVQQDLDEIVKEQRGETVELHQWRMWWRGL